MIWQLMKLDVAWRFVIRTTILFSAFAALWHFFAGGSDGPASTLLLMCFVPLFSLGVTPFVQPIDTRFHATLPATVRQVFAARMLSALALQWLPLVTGAVILIVLGGTGMSGMPLGTWSVVTCIVLGVECAGIRGLSVREALPLVALPVLVFVLNLIVVAWDWPLQNSFAWTLTLVCCWMVTAAVVVKTWNIVPKSFQLAPAEPPSDEPEPIPLHRAATHGAPWKPVLRTLLPVRGLEYLVIFLVMCVVPLPLFVVFQTSENWTSARPLIRWMVALPVPPRAVLAAVVLPRMLSLTCGYLVGINLHFSIFNSIRTADAGLRTRIVAVSFIVGCSMLANLCALGCDTQRVRRVLPAGYWPALSTVLFMGAGMSLFVLQAKAGIDTMQWISSALPASLAGMAAVLLLVLGTILRALDATFRQVELPGKPGPGERS